MVSYLFIILSSDASSYRKKKMAQHPILTKQTKRSEAYENLLCSLETENDSNDLTLENSANLEFDR